MIGYFGPRHMLARAIFADTPVMQSGPSAKLCRCPLLLLDLAIQEAREMSLLFLCWRQGWPPVWMRVHRENQMLS